MNIIAGRKKNRDFKARSNCTERKKSLLKAELKLASLPTHRKHLEQLITINDQLVPDTVQHQDWHAALKWLHKAEANLQADETKMCKKEVHMYRAILCNNMAFVLNQLDNDGEAAGMMKKCLQHLHICSKEASSKEEMVALETLIIRMGVKYCAILSHAQIHSEAILQAESLLVKITHCLLNLSHICQDACQDCADTPETIATSEESRERRERVNFKRIVVKEASKLLASTEELPSACDLMGRFRSYFEQKMNNMYFWKDNQDNNFKSISKELFKQDNRQRNLLGLQKSSTFLDDFSLSEVMSLELMKVTYRLNTEFYYLLSSPKIIELLLMAAVCYFMMATERRFKEGSLDLEKMKITDKYSKLGRDSPLLESKILHLKAIELAGQHLSPNNQFLLHLINSFNKNYKSILDEIKEQSEIVRKTPEQTTLKPPKNAVCSAKKHKKGEEEDRARNRKPDPEDPDKNHKRRERCTSALKRVISQPCFG